MANVLAPSFECQIGARSGWVDWSSPALLNEVSRTNDLGVISNMDRFFVNDRHICDSIWPLLFYEVGWIAGDNDVDIGTPIRDPLTLELSRSFQMLYDVYDG